MKALAVWIAIAFSGQLCFAGEDLITTAPKGNGDIVSYLLNTQNPSPAYVLILFPGSTGVVNPRMEDGKLAYDSKDNSLIRARTLMIDDQFATVATNATQETDRIQTLLDDLHRRFPTAKIYLVGTSRGTFDTMALAGNLSDKIAGEIHTSSMSGIASFDAKKYENRHLVVHHRYDT